MDGWLCSVRILRFVLQSLGLLMYYGKMNQVVHFGWGGYSENYSLHTRLSHELLQSFGQCPGCRASTSACACPRTVMLLMLVCSSMVLHEEFPKRGEKKNLIPYQLCTRALVVSGVLRSSNLWRSKAWLQDASLHNVAWYCKAWLNALIPSRQKKK